ncbi:MAG: polyphenol oxidase family protein [Gemmatimonadales bacterium]
MKGATDEEPPGWQQRFGVACGITDRSTGSLGLSIPDPARDVMKRLREFRLAMRPQFSAFQIAHQVHGCDVVWHEGVAPGWHVRDDADGHVTRQAGLLLAVTVADCVPVYLVTRDSRTVGLLHAGWRGVQKGVLYAGVMQLTHQSTSTANVVMHCGVAICGACYEVGEEVARAVLGDRAKPGKQQLDLRAELARQAEQMGIGEVTISKLCTRCNNERFFSHRANGDGGRQIAYLGMPIR